MAVVGEAKLTDRDRQAEFSLEGRRTVYRETWRVITDDFNDDALVVSEAPGLPELDQHIVLADGSEDVSVKCVRKTPRQDNDSPLLWHVGVEYSSEVWEIEDPDPSLRRAVVEWRVNRFNEAIQEDITGLGLVNSAGQAFDPPPEEEVYRLVFTVSRIFRDADFDALTFLDYLGQINDQNFNGLPAQTVRLVDFSARERRERGEIYLEVSCTFEVKNRLRKDGTRDTWLKTRYLDNGQDERDPVNPNGPPVNIRDTRGATFSKVPLLNGAGRWLEKCRTTLAINATALDPIITVADSDVFTSPTAPSLASPMPFYVQVDAEVMQVVAIDGDVLSVVRGRRGTTAAAHTAGASTFVRQREVYREFELYRQVNFDELNLLQNG